MSKSLRCEVSGIGQPLHLVSTTCPSPLAGQILIKTKAVGLNPIDWKHAYVSVPPGQDIWKEQVLIQDVISYYCNYLGLNVQSWPASLGNEPAGAVEQVRPGVSRFLKGDKVMARVYPMAPETAAFQEYVIAQVTHTALIPSGLEYDGASSIPMGFMTAASTIYQGLKIAPFNLGGSQEQLALKSILVIGGSSTVGSAAVQILSLTLPYIAIIATCSPEHHARVASLGTTATLDYRCEDIVDRIRDATPDKNGADAILDAVNGVALEPSILQVLTGPKRFAELATGHNVKAVPEGVNHTLTFGRSIMSTSLGDKLFPALEASLRNGSYKQSLTETLVGIGLRDVEKGLQRLRRGVSGTKLVITL